jgi:hypothetical protein
MKRECICLLAVFAMATTVVLAQGKSDYKFGKVTEADFSLSAEKFDSGANAVIIADIGSTKFEGNNKGTFTLIFTRFMRVKIMNKNGFDIGNHQILLYHNKAGNAEKLYTLRGSTFNLGNGVISETKLDEKSIFNEKYSENYNLRKFSMPALQAGSIFDLEYTIKSDFDTELRPWSFQGEYPRLWSEYQVAIPSAYHYVLRMQGDKNFYLDTTMEKNENYSIREDNGTERADVYSISGKSIIRRWVKKNVAVLHEEPYTTTLDNYNAGVTFQLNYFQWNAENERHDFMATWPTTAKYLLADDNFGIALNYENGWMSDDLKRITEGAGSDDEKMKSIYGFIRDNFKASSDHGLYVHSSLKEVYRSKEGNVAEINMLLTAMLRKAGFKADPMILSTRENGIANAGYPMISEYNYVICVVFTGDKLITLDASRPYNGFGQLPVSCYNGYGHVINEERPLPLNFTSDSLRESSLTSVFISNDEKGKITGNYKTVLGTDITVGNFGVDSLNQYDFPLTIHYDFDLKDVGSADILYFSPMMGEGYTTNPFKAMERHYPVEMPYKIDETYVLSMDIPVGYQVDEIPKSARVKYNEDEGIFEYLIQKNETNIQMRTRIKLNKAFYPVEEYPTLRDFFAFVVKKEGEQIVFKKIK